MLPSNDLRTKPFSFKCPSGPVFEVNATAVAGECRGYTQLLLAEARRCKWNKTCSLTYRGHPIITTDKDWSGQCVSKTPESFEISFSCIKNKSKPNCQIVWCLLHSIPSKFVLSLSLSLFCLCFTQIIVRSTNHDGIPFRFWHPSNSLLL